MNVWQLRQLLSMYTPDGGEAKVSLDTMSQLFSSNTNQGNFIPLSVYCSSISLLLYYTTSGHEEALLLDSSQLKPLMMKELHYVEVEDVLTLPFPRTIRERLEEVERELHEEKKRKEEKSQKRAAKSLTKRAGSLRRRKDN